MKGGNNAVVKSDVGAFLRMLGSPLVGIGSHKGKNKLLGLGEVQGEAESWVVPFNEAT